MTPPTGSIDPALLARLLRQRKEMAQGPLFVEEGRGGDLIQAAQERLREAAARSRATPDDAGSGGGSPRSEASRTPRGSALDLPDDHEALEEIALSCTRCELCETRNRVVFKDGSLEPRVVVIGEAPGANEDATGLPFVGAAGKLLDLMLASVDLSRERDVYICNVLKCRPPGNRDPRPIEIETCAPYLGKQLELLSPRAILAVGTFAARWLTSQSSALGKIRGSVHSYRGVPVVVTYHPAALLRNAGWSRAAWDDLQLLRQVIDQT